MWKCVECGYQSKEGETYLSKITEKRERIYSNGSKGWEIVKEKKPLCKGCAE